MLFVQLRFILSFSILIAISTSPSTTLLLLLMYSEEDEDDNNVSLTVGFFVGLGADATCCCIPANVDVLLLVGV